jgi:hypothetical protein
VKFATKHFLLTAAISFHSLFSIKVITKKPLESIIEMFLELFEDESSLMIMAKTCGL